jgi:hypothetical protein
MNTGPCTNSRRDARSFLTLVLAVSLCGAARAEDLTGLWATDARNCDKVFSKTGSGYAIAKDADLYGSGFIIDGRRITTQLAKCDIKSSKQEGATTHLIASCATDVMLSNMQASFKIVSNERILRVFPGGSDMEIPYERCAIK